MKSTFDIYKRRGGTLQMIAEKWGVSVQAVHRAVTTYPHHFMLDYSAAHPEKVKKAWLKKRLISRKVKVLFDNTDTKQ